ncbi:MAG TPA: MBL fold metallo-hydrolase [Vicinamibacterales bacterium]|nr:MBL fold metallo-hydrolase [Vicinamibacterales bacterium]
MKIDRRQFIVLSSGALVASPLAGTFAQTPAQPPAPAAAPTPPPPVVPTFANVRRNVGTFTARGGTIGWLIDKDAVIVVDTQFADTAKMCLDGLKGKTNGRSIDVVLNTHHHADHTSGNGIFRPETKKLIAQTRVPELQRTVAQSTPNAPAPVVADTTFDKTWSQKFGDETVTASYNGPGHTGADAIIHFEQAQVVHMGDLLFHERHPRVDRPAGASIQNWIKILDKVAREMPGDTIYIAGHSKEGLPVAVDRQAVVRFRDYFDAVLTLVNKAIAGGQTKDAISATASLPGFENYQSAPPALTLAGVLGTAYDELTAK